MNAWLPQASYPCGFFSVASSVTAQYTKLFVLKFAPPLRKIIHLPYRQSSIPHPQFKNKKGILFLNFEFRTKSKLTHSTHIKQISSWNKYLMGREDFHQHKNASISCDIDPSKVALLPGRIFVIAKKKRFLFHQHPNPKIANPCSKSRRTQWPFFHQC